MPIAAPAGAAPRYGGLTSRIIAIPRIASQIAGLKARQSSFMLATLRPQRTPRLASPAIRFWIEVTARNASLSWVRISVLSSSGAT